MAQTFNNECPYCGSRDIEHVGYIDDFDKAADAEEYRCDGKCHKTFYMQNHDERMVMKPTMKDEYLASDSHALAYKGKLIKALEKLGIDANSNVCGNCVSFSFTNGCNEEELTCNGSCSFQDEKIVNFSISDKIKNGSLDARTDALECQYFYNFCATDLEKHADIFTKEEIEADFEMAVDMLEFGLNNKEALADKDFLQEFKNSEYESAKRFR